MNTLAGYIKMVRKYKDGAVKYETEYHYGQYNRLDSQSQFNVSMNGKREKVLAIVYEYEAGKKNTIGDFYMFTNGSTDKIDALKRYGKEQLLLLRKETLFELGPQGRKIQVAYEYTYEYSDKAQVTKAINEHQGFTFFKVFTYL
jgi:hypothetical protein